MRKLTTLKRPLSSLLIVCLLSTIHFLFISPSAAELVSSTDANPTSPLIFTVSTHNGLVSVKATEAPLKDVIERIGQALGIEVEARVRSDEKVTAEFHDLPLDQAIKRLSANYAYISGDDDTKLTKLIIYPKGEAAPTGRRVEEVSENVATRPNASPKPFKFEFNPADYIQRDE